MDWLKPMSGDSLRLITLRAASGNTTVSTLLGASSSYQPSDSSVFVSLSKRPGGRDNAPLPLIALAMRHCISAQSTSKSSADARSVLDAPAVPGKEIVKSAGSPAPGARRFPTCRFHDFLPRHH